MEDKVIDDSRKWIGKAPRPEMELVFGKKFRLSVWETCLMTMNVGEVSRFKVKKVLVMDYPAVAKTLRDTYDPRGKTKKPQTGHMCSMMAMQVDGGLGYDDLNGLMKEPKDLEFIIDLVEVQNPEDYDKETWQMDETEKLDSVPKFKAVGNDLFKADKVNEAAIEYEKALRVLEQLMLREKPREDEWLKLQELQTPLFLNLAQCELKRGDFYAAIERCDQVLDIEPDNVKATFRRAKANFGAWNPKDAKEDFRRVAKLDPTMEKAALADIRRIEEEERKKADEDKQRLKSLFN